MTKAPTRRQAGNALIAALLALAISGLTAATVMKNRRIELKRDAGVAESTVLDRLRNAVNAAMFENLQQIQMGQAIVKGEHSIQAESVAGDLIWRPTVVQLRSMGYLPEGWRATTSSLNGAAYAITLRRTPAGCAPVACDVEGQILITQPILDGGPGTPVDGVLIGPILTRAGADGGVSLGTSPALITGFGGTWSAPNPVAGSPAGVVALRVGTNTGGFSQFVRVGDVRDPALGGNLSAAGNLSIAGTSTLNGPVAVNGTLTANDGSGAPCVTLDRSGVVAVSCAGTLNARTGVFSETVSAAGGLTTGSATMFSTADPNAIQVTGGELFIRGPAGNLVAFQGGNITASGSLGGARIALTQSVVEGSACANTPSEAGSIQYSASADGSLAACVGTRWTVVSRLGRLGAACSLPGATASDSESGQTLVCRGGSYVRMAALLSNFVLMDTLALSMGSGPTYVSKPACDLNSLSTTEALIILTPNNEDALMGSSNILSGVNRYAVDMGGGWNVFLQRSSDSAQIGGNLIASLYCFYS